MGRGLIAKKDENRVSINFGIRWYTGRGPWAGLGVNVVMLDVICTKQNY